MKPVQPERDRSAENGPARAKHRPRPGDLEREVGAADRPGLPARLVAARLLAAIVDARTSADGLLDPAHGHPGFRALDPRDQALVRAIVLSSLRFRGSIEARLARLLQRPLPRQARALSHILHVGAAQILHLDVPDSAAVDLAVAAARQDPRSSRFSGLVNAVLRRMSAEKSADGPADRADPLADCPAWLLRRLVDAYGEPHAAAIAAMHLVPAPLDLTVKSDPQGWADRLGGRALATGTVRLLPEAGPVTGLSGFAEGEWWVQDAAAALPAGLFGDVRGQRIADLCAAPGGKTAQLSAAGARVTALDLSRNRLKRLSDNLDRLRLPAELQLADLRTYRPAEAFDGVFLDAPCSSTGTIRRHPDVAYTKGPQEVEALAALQAELLAHAAELVKPGGLLVFSNCSLDPREGEHLVKRFLTADGRFARVPVLPDEVPGVETAVGPLGDLRTTPAMLDLGVAALSGLDGFFAARLRRSR